MEVAGILSKNQVFTGELVSKTEKRLLLLSRKDIQVKGGFFIPSLVQKSTWVLDPKLGLQSCNENVSLSLQSNKEWKLKIKI